MFEFLDTLECTGSDQSLDMFRQVYSPALLLTSHKSLSVMLGFRHKKWRDVRDIRFIYWVRLPTAFDRLIWPFTNFGVNTSAPLWLKKKRFQRISPPWSVAFNLFPISPTPNGETPWLMHFGKELPQKWWTTPRIWFLNKPVQWLLIHGDPLVTTSSVLAVENIFILFYIPLRSSQVKPESPSSPSSLWFGSLDTYSIL